VHALAAGYHPAMTVTDDQKPLSEQLDELGAQLDWVREYL
jgi:leucyl-tRNA synthetase